MMNVRSTILGPNREVAPPTMPWDPTDRRQGSAASWVHWLRRHTLGRWLLQNRIWLLGFGHAVVFSLAYMLAFGLRFDFLIPVDYQDTMWATLPMLLVVKLSVFYSLGHCHGWWRYVTFADLVALIRASVLALLLLVLLNHYLLESRIPRVVVVLDAIVATIFLGSLRASWRLYREQWAFRRTPYRPTLMVGADDQSVLLAHQIHSHPQLSYRVVGLLDADERRMGIRMGGLPIVGSPARLRELAASYRATDALVIGDTLEGSRLRELMAACDDAGIRLKIVPPFWDQIRGDGALPLRDVDIEDLLRREPVQLDLGTISQDLAGKTILVTGAGGSIGSEICRQLIPFGPKRIILVDQAENSLFLIHHELAAAHPQLELRPQVADILDAPSLRRIFERWRPEWVIHAAAHKHVGLMEQNVAECVRNNVFGTKIVADLAHEFQALKFVLISTDKAVNPTSVMGASKHIAERYVNALAQESTTAFIVVRFGNVLGSNGSVVPIFKDQIRRGGPITITDERMTRFFMTIPEASQLVLQAAAMGRGGEIFVLEMGEQVSIVDLARDLVRLSGLPSDAIKIDHVGIRPGEKLYEELYFDEEQSLETDHPKVRAAYHRPHDVEEVRASISSLGAILGESDTVIREQLQVLIAEYQPPGLPRRDAPPTEPTHPQPVNAGELATEPTPASI